MKSIFVTRSGFVALADKGNVNHRESVALVTTLFAETIKVYSILVEVVAAHEELVTSRLKETATDVLNIALGTEGITLLDVDLADVQAAIDLTAKIHIPFSVALVVSVARHHGIRDIFSWDSNYQKAHVKVVPRSGV